ncbi:MAG: DUF262 domain-containing protein [Prevotella sp.]|nr:DUF262 domain-containing protein [Prevotella sp.]
MGNTIPPLTERLTQQGLKTTITLQDYINILNNKGCFVIPDYQRGYVWGQRKKGESTDSVSHLIHTLKKAYHPKQDIFLQGVTVHEKKNSYDIVLVDGQQRTTFFFLLLKYLGYEGYLKIKYDIRNESNMFLCRLDVSDSLRDDNEKFQDVFFFKRTLRIFQRELENFIKTKEDFLHFILNYVKFLFVIIPEDQAKLVFTMMNGNKSIMTDEELIKAELLRCASLKHCLIAEAEHSEIRGRLAREWDQWLYWWNTDEVKSFFRTDDRQLGWLLPLILQKKSKVTFSEFREELLKIPDIKQSKAVFKKMRLLQKSIEDKYNDSRSYNYLGVILYIRSSAELRYSFLRWFFTINNEETHTKSDAELKRYFDWCIIGVNHEDIVGNKYEKYNEARSRFLEELQSNLLFKCHYETAYRWLIRQNIKQDNLHNGRKFNFEIERNRSLEHVYPKSKIGHESEEGVALDWDDKPLDGSKTREIKLWREEMKWVCIEDNHVYYGSEHCIGNLVLLYKRDNSKFNDADFEKKNEYFFTDQDDDAFKSRHLIHTTMVFSDVKWQECENWNPKQVPRRKQKEISEFINEYPEKNE